MAEINDGKGEAPSMSSSRPKKVNLPLQVAAVCYRRRGADLEFLLVNSNGGNKWTFPKGNPDAGLSHSQSAEREALEEAGAHGSTDVKHFHLYIHSKGVFWESRGVQEFVVKAFLLEVEGTHAPFETNRNPTWFTAPDAKQMLKKGREVKYGRELETVIDRAIERITGRQGTPQA